MGSRTVYYNENEYEEYANEEDPTEQHYFLSKKEDNSDASNGSETLYSFIQGTKDLMYSFLQRLGAVSMLCTHFWHNINLIRKNNVCLLSTDI